MAKGSLAVLLGVPGKSKGGASEELQDFARDLLDAIKDDDAEAAALALKGALTACKHDDEDEESEEDY